MLVFFNWISSIKDSANSTIWEWIKLIPQIITFFSQWILSFYFLCGFFEKHAKNDTKITWFPFMLMLPERTELVQNTSPAILMIYINYRHDILWASRSMVNSFTFKRLFFNWISLLLLSFLSRILQTLYFENE